MMMVTYEWKCVCIRSFVAFFLMLLLLMMVDVDDNDDNFDEQVKEEESNSPIIGNSVDDIIVPQLC